MPACNNESMGSPRSSSSSGCEGTAETCTNTTRVNRVKRKRRRRRLLTGVSRQRRAANERERRRVQGVNNAFVELKSKIPVLEPDDVSKMETLHLAAKWIAHLTTLLIEDDDKRDLSSNSGLGLKCVPPEIKSKLEDFLSFELEEFEIVDLCSELAANSVRQTRHKEQEKQNRNCVFRSDYNCYSRPTIQTPSINNNNHLHNDVRLYGNRPTDYANVTESQKPYDVVGLTHPFTAQMSGYHQTNFDCTGFQNFLDYQGYPMSHVTEDTGYR